MTRQLRGSIAWEYTHADGHFQGYHYCIGYCPNCKTKQVINEQGIAEFNKRSLVKLSLSTFPRLQNLMHCLKRFGRLRIRLELADQPEPPIHEIENPRPVLQKNLTGRIERNIIGSDS